MKEKKQIRILISLSILVMGSICSDPAKGQEDELILRALGEINTNGTVVDVRVSENCAYIADDQQGFLIYNVSDPSNPRALGQSQDAEKATGIFVMGSLAYVSVLYEGLKIYNVSNAAQPKLIGQYYDNGAIVDLYVRGNIAYLADHHLTTGGLKLIDISEPNRPVGIARFDDGGTVGHFHIVDDIAYIADYDEGIEIVDISDPGNLTELGQCSSGRPGYFAVYVLDNIAFATNNIESVGLEIYDVKESASPVLLSNYSDAGRSPGNLQVEGGFAYIIDDDEGLVIVDVHNPANPLKAGNYYVASSHFFDVWIEGNIAYIADLEGYVHIIQVWGEDESSSKGTSAYEIEIVLLGIIFLMRRRIVEKKKPA